MTVRIKIVVTSEGKDRRSTLGVDNVLLLNLIGDTALL